MKDCIFCQKPYKESPTFIKDYGKVRVLLNYAQPTLGSVLIVPNNHITTYSEMTDEEIAEYARVRKNLDIVLKKSFDPETINFYELFMVEPHLHGHFVPRYKTPREFNGKTYIDPGYGTKPSLGGEKLPQEILNPIIEKIKSGLNSL